jgi:hypothetical protein
MKLFLIGMALVSGSVHAEVIPYSWGRMVAEKTHEPLLRIRGPGGRELIVFDLKAVRALAHREDYAILNPFVLRFACFEGDANRVSEEILLNRNFLDHYGDFSCPVEAEVRDANRIEYSCVQSDSTRGARSFSIKTCPEAKGLRQ